MQKKVINLLQNSRKTKTEKKKKMTGEVRSYERKRGMYILYEKCVIIQEIKRNRKKMYVATEPMIPELLLKRKKNAK